MKFSTKSLLALLILGTAATGAKAIGWPANYEGVMLQGFYWDSYTDTKWTNLEAQSDELSNYFSLIWVPNSGYCGGSNNMGYMPIYWFTNHNSSFGTEAELISMIKTFKEKGTGIIADCVINHRNGATNWTDFPAEQWNGTTWHIGPEGICSTDEVRDAAGQETPTGAADTGDDFNGARDLDHTNANVQNNCKNYVLCLKEKYGYTGMRYDMVKGYSGIYNKIYNEYANVEYSVGEYWDSSYDAVAAWIDATGKTSAAFDFPCKYAINDAFSSNDMTKLVWKANGTNNQPAGMIHFGYSQYAVTFVDNHDTYRDGSKFTGNVEAANAFIICSPGTPCVFLPHWKSYKSAIKKMIAIRNAVGVHNNSVVNVLQSSTDCYMAEVTGSKGKLVVKVGSSMTSPSGYTNSDIKASGTDWCIWTKTEVPDLGDDDPTPSMPSELYILGNLDGASWVTSAGMKMTKSGTKFTASSVKFVAASGETKCYFNLSTILGADWNAVNGADRYGASAEGTPLSLDVPSAVTCYKVNVNSSDCKSWTVDPGKYDVTVNFVDNTITVKKSLSGVDAVTVSDGDVAPVYYNLQGVKVDNPSAGFYIVVRGNTVTKEVVR